MATANRKVLPGFSLTLGYTVFYLSLLVLLPISACFMKAASLSVGDFWSAVWSERARAAYLLTFGASFVAAIINLALGVLVAWVLVRYDFPAKKLIDSLVDLPLALPTAVGGLVYASLYVEKGWLGQFLVPWGIHGAYTRFGIVLVLVFVGLPFVVRTVQPVLEEIEPETEEAASSLGARRWQTFRRVILPTLYPAMITGFALAFALHRGVRLGGVRVGQQAVRDGDRPDPDRGPPRGVRLRRGDSPRRRAVDDGLLHVGGDQHAGALEQAPCVLTQPPARTAGRHRCPARARFGPRSRTPRGSGGP
jgi:sulfate transport system permease protein